jgi:hypothetical protein
MLKELAAFHRLVPEANGDNVENLDEDNLEDARKTYNQIKDEVDSFNVTGIVSMENVLESLLGLQILDEKDHVKKRRATMVTENEEDIPVSKSKAYGFMRQSSVINPGIQSPRGSNQDKDDNFYKADEDAGVYKAEYLNQFFNKV